jgi:hypothetical protein
MSLTPKATRSDVYAQVYIELLDSKVESPRNLMAEV